MDHGGEDVRPAALLVGNHLSRHVATRTVGEELAERLGQAGFSVTTASDRRPRLWRLLDMQRAIWRGRYDVAQIDVYSGAAFRWAEAAGFSLRQRRVPFVLTLHGGLLPEFATRHPRRVKRLLERAAAVTTPSRFLLEAFEAIREDLVLLPNPLDLERYPFTERQRPSPNLVWLRAFHRVYRPELAVETLARLLPAHPAARLLMVGPDKDDGSLEETRRAISRHGLEERVEITGAVPKSAVPFYLDRGDVFLNTSDVDNAPVSVVEAMACGLAVVSTDAGGIPHLLRDGEDALIVPRGDADALARAVDCLLSAPGLAARLSRQARETAAERDWSRVLPRWEALLREVAARSTP